MFFGTPTKNDVRAIVHSITDMTASWCRRYWCDKTAFGDEYRLLAFRFFDAAEADRVAAELRRQLTLLGCEVKVKRTSVKAEYVSRTAGGEYVRLRVLNR